MTWNSPDPHAEFYRERIEQLLTSEDLGSLVEEYLDDDSDYAAYSFDLLETAETDSFSIDDFLTLGFLDTPLKARSFRELTQGIESLDTKLARIDKGVPLWEMIDNRELYEASNELWKSLKQTRGLGPTRVSKLMARKRPHSIPILDRRVSSFFDWKTRNFWRPLGQALQDETLRDKIGSLRPNDDRSGAPVPPPYIGYRNLEAPGQQPARHRI